MLAWGYDKTERGYGKTGARMTISLMYDATHDNIGHLPPHATYAGYTTGSGGIAWTAADWKKFPDAVRIDQDASAADPSADILDVENGAATPAECPGWARRALASFASAARPGQRSPAIYAGAAAITTVANALTAGGVTSGVGLWVANWNLTDSEAVAAVTAASGPFPVIAVQFRNAGPYDISVVSTSWLTRRSAPPVTAHVPPGQWLDPAAWTWQTARLSGTGLDGNTHEWDYHPGTGQWSRAT